MTRAAPDPRPRRRTGLRLRLLGLVVLVLAPAFALVAFNRYQGLLEQRADARDEALRIARNRALALADKLDDARTLLDLLGTLPQVRDDPRQPACSDRLAALQRLLPQYLNLGVAQPDGTLACSATPFDRAAPPRYTDRAWYRALRAATAPGAAPASGASGAPPDRLVATEYVVGRLTRQPMLISALPLPDATGALAGFAFAGTDAAWLARSLGELRLAQGAALVVLDAAGRIVARQPQHDTWVGTVHPDAARLLAAAAAGPDGAVEAAAADGIVRLGAFARVPRTELVVFYGVPRAAAEARARAAFERDLGWMAAILAASIALAWGATEVFVRRELLLERRVAERAAALEAALREADDLYQNAPCGYHSVDAAGRIVRVNDTELGWLGYQRDELVGRPVAELMTPASLAAFGRHFPEFVRTGRLNDVEFEFRRRDGTLLPVSVSASAVRDADGRLLMSHSTLFDITERRHAAAEVERASRMKSEFLASMSHELRTPLHAIIGFSEALRDGLAGELTPTQREYLQDILDGGVHLLALVNDILDLSKVEAGTMTLTLAPLPVARVLRDALAIVRDRAAARGTALEVDVAADVGDVIADERKVKQIVVNLLSNAVKFTPPGGRVTLAARCVPLLPAPADAQPPAGTQQWLEIAVTDTGIGIAPQDQARLFTPFTQIDSSLARQYEGTGLGLALVKRLALLHGGAVALQSAPGAGSTFRVWLPYRRADAPA